VTNTDYPLSALRGGERGTTIFRLTVEADGSVSECVVVMSSGTRLLDDTTCLLMRKRAKFKPALDIAGKPVRDLWISRFSWELPGR
jgi:protein TonB